MLVNIGVVYIFDVRKRYKDVICRLCYSISNEVSVISML